jgi:hypothetical protein
MYEGLADFTNRPGGGRNGSASAKVRGTFQGRLPGGVKYPGSRVRIE